MQSVGTYWIESSHAAALEQLFRTGDDAGTDAIATELARLGANGFVAARIAERDAGDGHTFVVMDRRSLLGLCDLRWLADRPAAVDVWIAPPFRRRGHGSLGLRMMLEFAFVNRRLELLEADAGDDAGRALLAKHGFTQRGGGQRWAIDPAQWRQHRDAPALARLLPSLRTLLDAELAAGNEIAETGGGWPDTDSVFVRLRHPFRARPASLPAGVTYQELNDPHWWKAEYASASPRHLLVY
jgi:hypothetical protein